MARSIKKTLHYTPNAGEFAWFKRKANKILRRNVRIELQKYDDATVFPLLRECSDLWVSPRDGFCVSWWGNLDSYKRRIAQNNEIHQYAYFRSMKTEWWRSYYK